MNGSNLLHAGAAVTAQLDKLEKLTAPLRRDQAVREWLESIAVPCYPCDRTGEVGVGDSPAGTYDAWIGEPADWVPCDCCKGKARVSLRHFLLCDECQEAREKSAEEIEGSNDDTANSDALIGAAIRAAARGI